MNSFHPSRRIEATALFRLLLWILTGLGLAGGVRADSFVFEWSVLTGDYDASPPVLLDLDGDPVPKRIWGATGEITGAPSGDFPLTSAWLAANYGPPQGYVDMLVKFELGTVDTSLAAPFELDQSSFTNDPATGTAKMTFLPAGGAPSVPVNYYLGGRDAGSNETVQLVATGHVTEIRLEMNSMLGWSGFGNFHFVASTPAPGPVSGTQAPLFAEVMALIGGSAPFRTPITIGEIDYDPAGQAAWLALGLPGQISDARVLGALGAGYAGEASGVTQSIGDLVLPSNGRLVDRDGEFHFDPRDLDPLGRWFDPPLVSAYSYRTRDGNHFSGVGLPVGIDTVDGRFTLWFDGTSRVVNEGVFFSFADYRAGGGGLVDSFRITDIEPTVDAANPLAFPVRLAFWNGVAPVKTASFAIRPAVRYQVDNLIGLSRLVGRAKGNGIYNRTGIRQTLRVVYRGTKRVSAFLILQNDGEGPDRFRLRGPGGNRSLGITYLSGGNRTALVRRGNYRTPVLNPKASRVVRVTLRPVTGTRVQRKLSLLARSSGDGTRVDVAKLLLRCR